MRDQPDRHARAGMTAVIGSKSRENDLRAKTPALQAGQFVWVVWGRAGLAWADRPDAGWVAPRDAAG